MDSSNGELSTAKRPAATGFSSARILDYTVLLQGVALSMKENLHGSKVLLY